MVLPYNYEALIPLLQAVRDAIENVDVRTRSTIPVPGLAEMVKLLAFGYDAMASTLRDGAAVMASQIFTSRSF